MRVSLTRVKLHFTDHQPFGVEVELDFDESSDVEVQRDVNRSGVFDQRVPGIGEFNGTTGPRSLPSEVDLCPAEDPRLFAEHVVRVDHNCAEVAHSVESEEEFEGLGSEGLISPPHPLVTLDPEAVRVQPEVRLTLEAVGQLTKTPEQEVLADGSVVGEVKQIDLWASLLSLRNTVTDHTIYKQHRALHNSQELYSAFK